jgi:hypothetical protein
VRISSFRFFLHKYFKGWDSHVLKYRGGEGARGRKRRIINKEKKK